MRKRCCRLYLKCPKMRRSESVVGINPRHQLLLMLQPDSQQPRVGWLSSCEP